MQPLRFDCHLPRRNLSAGNLGCNRLQQKRLFPLDTIAQLQDRLACALIGQQSSHQRHLDCSTFVRMLPFALSQSRSGTWKVIVANMSMPAT